MIDEMKEKELKNERGEVDVSSLCQHINGRASIDNHELVASRTHLVRTPITMCREATSQKRENHKATKTKSFEEPCLLGPHRVICQSAIARCPCSSSRCLSMIFSNRAMCSTHQRESIIGPAPACAVCTGREPALLGRLRVAIAAERKRGETSIKEEKRLQKWSARNDPKAPNGRVNGGSGGFDSLFAGFCCSLLVEFAWPCFGLRRHRAAVPAERLCVGSQSGRCPSHSKQKSLASQPRRGSRPSYSCPSFCHAVRICRRWGRFWTQNFGNAGTGKGEKGGEPQEWKKCKSQCNAHARWRFVEMSSFFLTLES